MLPTRWLLALPLGCSLVLGGCARKAYTGVHRVASDQLSKADGKQLFEALHIHCWRVDLPDVTGDQYVVVKLDLHPAMSITSPIRTHDRHVIVAVSENGQNQVWSIINSTGSSGFNFVEPNPLPSPVRTSSTIFDQGERQNDGTVRLAHWEFADSEGKQTKTVDAVVTVEKWVGQGPGHVVK